MSKNINKTIVQPLPVFMVGSYDENGVVDVMNAAWAGQWGPENVAITFALSRQTLKNIQNNKEFTVAYATKDTLDVADFFGLVSASKDEDKVKRTGVTVKKSENINAPIVEEFPITLECELMDIHEIVPDRCLVVGKVINTVVSDDLVDDDGNVDTTAIEFISYDGNTKTYRVLGDVVGKAFNAEVLKKF